MFKKLKEKITEEVKSSPQRFQQLTQSVSDRLQNSSTSDENFFSIGEDDANTSNASIESGFTNVSLMSPQENRIRRNSSSSVASDVSFLPRYESVANMYHLQSDLDISASEIEDNASTSSQLGHLSKEQIYSAFQKAQMRYHKYRGRYTDLAKHYKDLERENGKMKSVLVDTQDKAIRRVTELKEQCSLEQKAKAHLEEVMRDEIDEKQFKIQSLQMKIELLQNGAGQNQDQESLENLNKYLTDARLEIETLNERIQEMKANSIIFQTKEQEYKTKIANLEKEISLFSEREKENNLSLAQNKMELHNELLSKDAEISNLKQDNEALKKSLEAMTSGNGKLENLQTQNMKLIEKLENLGQKCNAYESDLLKMEQFRIEIQNVSQTNVDLKSRLKEAEDTLNKVREDAKKSLLSLEAKIREKLQKEFVEKEDEVRNEFKKKFEEISSNADNLQEIQLNLIEKDEEIRKLREVNDGILDELTTKSTKYDELERNHLELIEDSVGLRSKISNLEKELAGMQNENQVANLKITRLENDTKILENKIENSKQLEDSLVILQEEKEDLLQKLQANEAQTRQLQDESSKSSEIELLESQMRKLEEEKNTLLENFAEERRNAEELSAINLRLNQEVDHLKTSIQKREMNLDEMKKDLEKKLEEEKEKLLQKLNESENTVRKLEETSLSFNEELRELRTKNEEIVLLQTDKRTLTEILASKEDEVKKLEEMNAKLSEKLNELRELEEEKEYLRQNLNENENKTKKIEETNAIFSLKIQKLEEETKNLFADLENERRTNSILKASESKVSNLEEINSQLNEQIKNVKIAFEEQESFKLQQLEEKESKIKSLEERINDLNEELTTLANLLKIRNEEIVKLKKDNLKNAHILQERDGSVQEVAELLEERNHLLEEIDLLKKLLEEANNNLTIKDHDLEKIKTKYSNSGKKIEKLSKEIKNQSQFEKDLSTKVVEYEKDLKLKSQQIDALSKKLDEYSDLIEERNDGFFKILNNLPGEPPNNFRRIKDNKNLQNLEEKLQNFEHTFSIEKENLVKMLLYLKQFEDRYSSLLNEKNQLSDKKEELLKQIEELQGQIQELNSARISAKQIEEELMRLKEENTQLNEDKEKMKQSILELESKKEKLLAQIGELQGKILELSSTRTSVKHIEEELVRLKEENASLIQDQERLKQSILELESRNTQVVSDSNFLSEENHGLITEIEELKLKSEGFETKYDHSQLVIDDLKNTVTKLKNDLKDIGCANNQNQLLELERQNSDLQHEKQLLQEEILELKTTPINVLNSTLEKNEIDQNKEENYVKEIENLRTKVVQYKSLDLTNRSSIEFYENELQKLKNQNEKLNRKLDETLVTLNHCSELSNSTEIEYLKNVLYNYMLGKESLVLARVIAAVCKFDPHQTETVLAKEQQKQTLLGHLGIL